MWWDARESRSAQQASSGGFRDREVEEFSSRILSAENELRRAGLKTYLLMTTLNEYKVQVKSWKKLQ